MGRPDRNDSERQWLDVRNHYRGHHHELAERARNDFPELDMVEDAPLLTVPAWTPEDPVLLEEIGLEYVAESVFCGVTGKESLVRRVLPTATNGAAYDAYSDVVAALATPAVFENRTTYRLLDADLSAARTMTFGRGGYFDAINVGDAAAHEFTAHHLGRLDETHFRDRIGNPCDPTRRPTNVALSTLTLRHDPGTGKAMFPLHRRSGTVGHAAGMYQALPVGIFQPAGDEPWNVPNDFDLWRNIVRELAEELRGDAEDYATEAGPIDYMAWPFAARLEAERSRGRVRTYCLGIGVDPLTFATDVLTVAVIDAATYDKLFGRPEASNTEGDIVADIPFIADAIDHYTNNEPIQAAGAALLRRAWRHRNVLIG